MKKNILQQNLSINKDFSKAEDVIAADINVIIQDSLSASSLFKDESCFFVFLDGDHGYENVKKEIELWLPKIRIGGYLGGHDYPDPNVNRAVTEMLDNVEPINNYFEPDIYASFLYRKN